MMVVLHIANIQARVLSGVNIAVPEMALAQNKYVSVGFLNLEDDEIEGIVNFSINDIGEKFLPIPFDKTDIVVFHEVYRIEYIKLYRLLKKRGIPYVIIPHGCLTREAQNKKALKKFVANFLLFKSFVKGAKAIQYLSENEKNNSIYQYNSFVKGNGIKISEKKKDVLVADTIKLIYIGRLEIRIKGIDILLEAVSKVRKLMPKVKFKLYIYGPESKGEHAFINQLINEKGISDVVVLNRELTGKDKEKALLSADYFIQTSRTEGMPMGLLEALGYGLPCIVTEGTGLSEIIAENNAGFGCKTSADGIAEAIIKALENHSEYSRKSECARNLAKKHFDKDDIAARTIDIYKQIADR